MERKTLGNLNVNRVSEIRQSMTGKKSSTTNSRTSSVGSGSGMSRTHKKQDPRPIGQSQFMQKCVKDIVSYLSSTNQSWDKEMGIRLAKNPMTRDFLVIMDFLTRRLDNNFKAFLPGLVERKKGTQASPFDMEIILVIYDFLGYPVPINKRNLISVGAPHSWPYILAAVHWLVELNRYQDSTAQNTTTLEDKEESFQFFMFLSKSYKTFLQNDSSDPGVIEEEMKKLFSDKEKDTIIEIEKLSFEVSNLQNEISIESPLISLERKKMDYEMEIEKLKKLVQVREESKKKLEDTRINCEQESHVFTSSIQKLQYENEMLKKQISLQDIRPEDVKKMYSDLARLEESSSSLSKRYEECKTKDWELENQVKVDGDYILSTVQTFNRLVVSEKYLIDLQRFDPTSLIHNLKNLYQETVSKSRSASDLHQNYKEQLERIEWEKTELMDTQLQLNNKVRRLEDEFRKEKETWRKDLQQQALMIDTMEEEVRFLRIFEQNDQELKSTYLELDRLNSDLEAKKSRFGKEEKGLTDYLFKTLELMTEHKERVQRTLVGLEEKFKTILSNE